MRTTLSLRLSILLILSIFIMVLDASRRDEGHSEWATRRRELLERSGKRLPKTIILKPESHEIKIPREEAERRMYPSHRSKPKKSKKSTTHKPLRINHGSEESFNSFKDVKENIGQEFLATTLTPKPPKHTKNRRKLPKPIVLTTSSGMPSNSKEFDEESKRNEESRPFKWYQAEIQRKVEEKAGAQPKSKEELTVHATSEEKSEIRLQVEENSTSQRNSEIKSTTFQQKSEERSTIIPDLEAQSPGQRKSRRRPPTQLRSEEKSKVVQFGRSLTHYEESFGKKDEDVGDTVRRKKADETDPAPAPERDEMVADPVAEKNNMTGLGYPEEVIPGLTCLTEDEIKKQMKVMNVHYGKQKCPRKLPCRKFMSCVYFKTGLLTKTFGINLPVAKDYYSEVFRDLHKEKKKEIMTNFEECVAYYKLEEPFDGSKQVVENTPMPEISHTHKPKTKRQIGEESTTAISISSAEDDDKPKASTDCFSRIQDFLECKEIVELKGTCYWPHKEKA